MRYTRVTKLFAALALLGLALALGSAVAAEDREPVAAFTGSDGHASADFYGGGALALSADLLVVGSHGDDIGGVVDSGSAYVFERNSIGDWIDTKLIPSDPKPNAQFGRSAVVTAGGSIAVGAPFSGSGSLHLFTSDGAGGHDEATLTAFDVGPAAGFGWSVASDGDHLLVGAPGDSVTSNGGGSAHLLVPDGVGGYGQRKFVASDVEPSDVFGSGVALLGDTVVVGAPRADEGATDSGAVYLFRLDGAGGYGETKISASDPGPGDLFGLRVAISPQLIAVSAEFDDGAGLDAGAVYAFTPNGAGGFDEVKLTASDAASGARFGASLAVLDDRIVVGAPGASTAYVFRRDVSGGFTEEKLTAPSGATIDGTLGQSVAAAEIGVAVGAPFGEFCNSGDRGIVYLFDWASMGSPLLCGTDVDDDGVDDALDNCRVTPNANQADNDGDGAGDACDPDDDNDGVPDAADPFGGPGDNCPFTPNPDQADADGDGVGDACDEPASDADGDDVPDSIDNCPATPNADQADNDGDGAGDACDSDDDNDGINDSVDNCPITANADQLDSDGDSTGDACDPDPFNTVTTDLLEGIDGNDVGDVTVEKHGDDLWVTIAVVDPDATILDSHLQVGDSLADAPTTRKGNPLPGQFDYAAGDPDGDGLITYVVPLPDSADGEYIIAAHVSLQRFDATGEPVGSSAWGAGTRFTPGKRAWATYMTYIC